MAMFVQCGEDRRPVPSLRPFLHHAINRPDCPNFIMDPAQMDPADVAGCAWIGWGIAKGVTHVREDVSVLAVPDELRSGLHAELIQGFPHTDPFPLCYDTREHVNGFGGFVRWVYFADPVDTARRGGVFGIDWSPNEPLTIGVAPSLHTVAKVAARALLHGIPPGAELALLNWKMLETPELARFRRRSGLGTVHSWVRLAPARLAPVGVICPKCTSRTFTTDERFCYRCGTNPRQKEQEIPKWHGKRLLRSTRPRGLPRRRSAGATSPSSA